MFRTRKDVPPALRSSTAASSRTVRRVNAGDDSGTVTKDHAGPRGPQGSMSMKLQWQVR